MSGYRDTPPTIPRSVEDITPAWLTAVLRAADPATPEVESVAFESLGGADSLASDVVKLSLGYRAAGPGQPAHLVAKLPSRNAQQRAAAFGRGAYQRETDFYRELAADAGIATIRHHYADYDAAEERFCLLLDFMSDGTAGENTAGGSAEQIMRASVALAQMHARWWGSRDLDRDWMRSFVDVPAPLIERLRAGAPVFVERFGELVPPRLQEPILTIAEWGPQKAAEFDKSPVTLLHGDCSVKNLFFPRETTEPVVAFDWARAGPGPAAGDVANLIVVSLEPDRRRAIEHEALSRYHQVLLDGGVVAYSREQLWRDYRLATVLQLGGPIVSVVAAGPGWAETAAVLAPRVLAAAEDLEVHDLL